MEVTMKTTYKDKIGSNINIGDYVVFSEQKTIGVFLGTKLENNIELARVKVEEIQYEKLWTWIFELPLCQITKCAAKKWPDLNIDIDTSSLKSTSQSLS